MLLAPIKYKLQLSDSKLADLYEVGECYTESSLGKHCRDLHTDFSYPAEYMCQDFGQAITRLLLMVAERTSGYCIPGTNFPYVVIAMRMFAKMGSLRANYEHQLAGLAWVLVYHKFATVEEIREICGDYVAELVTVNHNPNKLQTDDNSIFSVEITDIYRKFTGIQRKFIRIETSLLLDVLRNIRTNHDCAFREANPEPIDYLYEDIERVGYMMYVENQECYYDSGFRRCDGEYNYYDGDIDCDYSDMNHYFSKGYRIYECKKDEFGHIRGAVLEVPYTPEYMEYCDKCRDLFWQRFGLKYEDVEKMLITIFWDGKSPWNPVNDLLYEVSKRYYVFE